MKRIDYTYIINLNTSNEEITEKIKQSNFQQDTPYYIYPAVNGWDKKSTKKIKHKAASWWKIDSDNSFWNREVTPGEIGCTLSHYNVIKGAYESGHENILIFEEDFTPLGKFPSLLELSEVPSDCSILYLDRNALWPDKETRISKNVTEVGYTYNNHAYIVTRKGMKEVIDSKILDNIIISDEFFPAINGTSDRKDAVKKFHNKKFKAYALNGGYFNQKSDRKTTSLTEFTPEEVNKSKQKTGNKTRYKAPIIKPKPTHAILDDSNWAEWCKKYINPLILNKEYDLAIDEPCNHVYTFPFFTKAFCDELIELSETFVWVNDRHEFYPTTDNLLETLGMNQIYNRLINDHIKPLAINRYQLEGKSWDHLADESFIIRYKQDEQSHLSLHHDHSSITTLLNLNSGGFKGGGTYFPKYKCLVNPKDIGVMTLHPGNITHKHGARPVTEGVRYVVVSFIKNSDLQ
jgi:GR25 family glycosyltransferase involved in LPS biosynthesis